MKLSNVVDYVSPGLKATGIIGAGAGLLGTLLLGVDKENPKFADFLDKHCFIDPHMYDNLLKYADHGGSAAAYGLSLYVIGSLISNLKRS